MVGCRWIHPTPLLINRYQVNFVKGVILSQLNQIIALRLVKATVQITVFTDLQVEFS